MLLILCNRPYLIYHLLGQNIDGQLDIKFPNHHADVLSSLLSILQAFQTGVDVIINLWKVTKKNLECHPWRGPDLPVTKLRNSIIYNLLDSLYH